MKLQSVRIEGYRSIRDSARLVVEPTVTVVLGANDHGKTNLLAALVHLNSDEPFKRTDLNWDRRAEEADLPACEYTFSLSPTERQSLLQAEVGNAFWKRIEESADASRQRAHDLREASNQLADDLRPEEALEALGADLVPDSATYKGAKAAVDDVDRAREEAKTEADAAEALAVALTTLVGASSPEYSIEDAFTQATTALTTDIANQQSAADRYLAAEQAAARAREAAEQAGDPDKLAAATKAHDAAVASTKAARARAGTARAAAAAFEAGWAGINVTALTKEAANDRPKLADIPSEFVLSRYGVGSGLVVSASGTPVNGSVAEFVLSNIPRVEAVAPVDRISDSVTFADLEHPEQEFMKGIFYYAGISREEWEDLFQQDEFSSKRLSRASELLNSTLTENWTQGAELKFFLEHESVSSRINLLISEPSVENLFVRPSKRSSGFTHFFALKSILHARRTEHDANSYIWLFDEPGIYLHPSGQADLSLVLETIGQSNQVVYATHSIFLISRTFPSRHRLVKKGERGTTLESKPYVGNWQTALSAVGLALPATVLFAPYVLLVEGDSDTILFWACLQAATLTKKTSVDLNSLSIMASRTSEDGEELLRELSQVSPVPHFFCLFDGDDGGKERINAMKETLDLLSVSAAQLPKGKTIEDVLPLVTTLFPQATANYVAKLTNGDPAVLLAELKATIPNGTPADGWAKWSRTQGKTVGKLRSTPSSVGIAREYVELLRNTGVEELNKAISKELIKVVDQIAQQLGLPSQVLVQDEIIKPRAER